MATRHFERERMNEQKRLSLENYQQSSLSLTKRIFLDFENQQCSNIADNDSEITPICSLN